MANRTPWLVGGAVLAVAVMAVFLWRGCGPAPTSAPADFVAETVVLDSPDMDLELISVTGKVKETSTVWVCQFTCLEPGGCRADVRVVVHYRSQGDRRSVKMSGRFNGAEGDIVWLGRNQRSAEVVDRVDRVVVEMVARIDPAAPIPTLIR